MSEMTLDFTGTTANFEEWYETIKEFTPVSQYFRVSSEEKEALMVQTFDNLCNTVPYFSETHQRPNASVQEVEIILEKLAKKINEMIKGKEVFFRTNLFSPKDVRKHCFVSTGKEAIELLTSSYRMYKGYQELLKEKDLYLVFREKISVKEEFRCFVENGFIKGISQYDDSRSVSQRKGASAIYSFGNEDYLSLYHYVNNFIKKCSVIHAVIDIAHTPTGFMVIELNPFHRYTDKSLFANIDIYTKKIEETEIRFWKESFVMKVLAVQNGKVVKETEEVVKPTVNHLDKNSLSLKIKQLKKLSI
jgi:hypothetical protein